TQTFERQKTPGGTLLFGVWGTDQQRLWAVGGELTNPDRGGAVWRFNGTEWVDDPTVLEARPEGLPTLYKVWGTGPNDVYASGQRGVVLHFDGARWISIPTGVVRPLFTIHGDATRVVATGGQFEGVILELEGDSFVDRTPAGAPQMNGVFVLGGGPAAAVGAGGAFARRGADAWEMQPAVATSKPADFHAAWLDASGGVWAVGGDLTVDLTYGVLGYAGTAAIGREFVAEPCAPGVSGQAATVSYIRDIYPLFRRSGCLNSRCHTGPVPEPGYDLRTYQGLFGPGLEARSFGMCDVVPGNPRASFLIEKLGPEPRSGVRMPNGFPPLRDEQIAMVYTWIREGAINDTPPPGRPFTRGDADADGRFIITDPIALLLHLFIGGRAPACLAAADANDDGALGIDDAIYSLNFLFTGGPAPEAPFPACGQDPTPGDVECDASKCE
ncbi:MAG: hypothetical protein HY721_02810, partial [Planctomycetes bacterium]|nr:hypothetical protein [Planctomycetota bacterium]